MRVSLGSLLGDGVLYQLGCAHLKDFLQLFVILLSVVVHIWVTDARFTILHAELLKADNSKQDVTWLGRFKVP